MSFIPRDNKCGGRRRRRLLLGLFLCTLFSSTLWGQVTLNVVGVDQYGNEAPYTEPYRWLVEEDTTYDIKPGVVSDNPLSLNFHVSTFPVVATGEAPSGGPVNLVLDPAKRYFVSVLPGLAELPGRSGAPRGFSIGGSPIPAGATSVKVTVSKLPLPTAQISVFVFEDIAAINNSPDVGERGLGGFNIQLEDAGGRYGASAGTTFWDAYGNSLGTEYVPCTSTQQNCDFYRKYQVDDEGVPIVQTMGTGVLKTDANGRVTIKNLAPAKYGVIVIPPEGQGWQQTTTIEGTKVIDAWVAANEPPYFKEFGPASFHAFFGMIRPFRTLGSGPATITGRVVQLRMGRPPDMAFYNGGPFEYTTPWIGLNDLASGLGVLAMRGNSDGTFTIPNVPPGTYQLVVFDDNMDIIIDFSTVVVAADGTCNNLGTCNLGDVPVNPWFTRQVHYIFEDDGCLDHETGEFTAEWKGNGFREPCEHGIFGQNVNLRWRDGTINQAAATDLDGMVPFDEIFPFFSWQVAEVDFARFKATGVTVTVDDGGPVDANLYRSFEGQVGPQPQFCTAEDIANPDPDVFTCDPSTGARINTASVSDPGGPNNLSRTERGPVLTQGYQGFIGQTTVFEWGKVPYEPGENGGISGVVYYATTRPDDDPKEKVPAPWEAGIPNVTVQLWDSAGTVKLAETQTDSWDAGAPTGCQGPPFEYNNDADPAIEKTSDCFDGFRNHSQVRPAVFDGGYAFTECAVAIVDGIPKCVGEGTDPLPAGEYIVAVVPPEGYQVYKSQDKNVDFGDDYTPGPNADPLECVGTDYTVPDFLTLFPGVEANLAGQTLKSCDKKQVFLNPGQNGAADFFLFTEVPASARIIGTITDDLNNTNNPQSLMIGEKFSPRWIPIAIRDWDGRELARYYSDEFGRYNLLVPSTYTNNLPQPSGISPSMLFTCINARMIPNGSPLPAGGTCGLPGGCEDTFARKSYAEACYVFQFMPYATTYLDTPMFPIAAQAGRNEFPVDCELRDGTPRINQVTASGNGEGGGPYVPGTGGTVDILAVGPLAVPNPDFCPGPPWSNVCKVNTQTAVMRDYGFGSTQGTVLWGSTPLAIVSWTPGIISVTIPSGTARTDQLIVIRGDNRLSTVAGVTLTRGGTAPKTVGDGGDYTTIQAAIDAASDGDLILVKPGVYDEMVVMYKPVRLQGWGEGSTRINAMSYPGSKLAAWRQKVDSLLAATPAYLLPGQQNPANAPQGVKPLFDEEGAGVLVLSSATNLFTAARASRIDGFSISFSDGGGVVVNGKIGQTGSAQATPFLAVSNNRISSNYGIHGGGVRIGHPQLISVNGQSYVDAQNDNVWIHHNTIMFNGGTNGDGGGISVCTGADWYRITENFVCGNFMPGDGGGIGHLGLSRSGQIARNAVLFNESFNGQITVNGGGISISGQPPLAGAALSPGAGSVKLLSNIIQGNHAGAGDGGGVAVARFNGQDVAASGNQNNWYRLELYNNLIHNNIAGVAGGGVSLSDVVRSTITHNTIALNDSTATATLAFPPGFGACLPGAVSCPQQTIPQPAGLVSRAHSASLWSARNLGKDYADPEMFNNIIWHNRSFFFFGDAYNEPPIYLLLPDVPQQSEVFWDLGILGSAQNNAMLNPRNSLLTDTQGYHLSNISGDPLFSAQYFNESGNGQGTSPALNPAIAFDEGGNAIKVTYGPLTQTHYNELGQDSLRGNYHIGSSSAAKNAGTNGVVTGDLTLDFDLEPRPAPFGPQNQRKADIGADELQE